MELVIRREPEAVFNAFVDPEVTTQFWFDRASGPLVVGTTVTWFWDRYEASADVRVVEVAPHERIVVEWMAGTEAAATVEWRFEDLGDRGTAVYIVEQGGFDEDPAKAIAEVADSTGGFALVLAAAKAHLEYGVALNIVADKP